MLDDTRIEEVGVLKFDETFDQGGRRMYVGLFNDLEGVVEERVFFEGLERGVSNTES